MLLLLAWLVIAGFGLPWPLYLVAFIVWAFANTPGPSWRAR